MHFPWIIILLRFSSSWLVGSVVLACHLASGMRVAHLPPVFHAYKLLEYLDVILTSIYANLFKDKNSNCLTNNNKVEFRGHYFWIVLPRLPYRLGTNLWYRGKKLKAFYFLFYFIFFAFFFLRSYCIYHSNLSIECNDICNCSHLHLLACEFIEKV